MARENAFTGPYEHDIGQGDSFTIASRLVALREGESPPYYTPVHATGTLTTPHHANLRITGDTTWVFRLRKKTATSAGALANKYASGQISWVLNVTATDLRLGIATTDTTSFGPGYTVATIAQWNAIPAGVDFYLAVWVDLDFDGTNSKAGALLSLDGVVWTPFGVEDTDPKWTTDSVGTGALAVGTHPGGGTQGFDGRIYWAEQHAGLNPASGTVLWRFDATEYPGTGTTIVDPRGRTWTLQSATTMTRAGNSPAQAVTSDVVRAQALNRGATVGEYVYFRRTGGWVTQALMDDLVGPPAFPKWPDVAGYVLEYQAEWWPLAHGDMPAFQVKRASFGTNVGGDYVRASASRATIDTPVTGIKIQSNLVTLTTSIVPDVVSGQIVDVSVPAIPAANGRFEVLGVTTTPNTVSYLVTTGNLGQFATPGMISSVPRNLPAAVLKYPTTDPVTRSSVTGQALLYVQPAGYDSVQIEWDWPVEAGHIENWKEVSLVRSMFGAPTTPNDGQTIFRRLRKQMLDESGDLRDAPMIYDIDLTGGYWYYYTLFFNISPKAPDLGDWVVGYSDWAQVPKKYRHEEHLWNGLPPFYQYTDDNTYGAPLKRFLNLFGFELDFTRQSVECMQDMYHIDKCPLPLLKEIGHNFNINEEQGLGDIRFRATLADLPERLAIRGTHDGLQQTIETMSKYDTDVTLGGNLMLLPDDSSPFFSTGNWAGKHPNLTDPAPVLWNQVTLTKMAPDAGMPKVGEDGFIRITASVLGDVLITCGAGKISPVVMTLPPGSRNVEGEYIPLTNGIPVEETGRYGFAAYLRKSVPTTIPYVALLWFDATGQPMGKIAPPPPSHVGTPPSGGAPTDGTFRRHDVQGKAPVGAAYLVPAILVTARPSVGAYVDFTAAMVYMSQPPGTSFDITPPDDLLTLGVSNETIGAPPKPGEPSWTGYVMGSPITREGT